MKGRPGPTGPRGKDVRKILYLLSNQKPLVYYTVVITESTLGPILILIHTYIMCLYVCSTAL